MPRSGRVAAGGVVYHVLNRGNCRLRIFDKAKDYEAFLRLLDEAREMTGTRILGFCLMPNHWHLVLWPREDKELSRFVGWVSNTHVRRWREHRRKVGEGHLYQGRFKSFPVQEDPHLLTLLRYVEANPRRAGLVERAEQWLWSSISAEPPFRIAIDPWPVNRPANWLQMVNRPLRDDELEDVRRRLQRGQPFGTEPWTRAAAQRFGLAHTLRDPWRPKKAKDGV
jgi:REP-associated tyrosine transposase